MRQSAFSLFLALYLAHLLGDFVFQTSHMVGAKKRGAWTSYLLHGATHFACTLFVIAFTNPALIPTRRFEIVVVLLCMVHLLLDWVKISLLKAERVSDNVTAFVVDQAAHLVTVVVAALIIARPTMHAFEMRLQIIRTTQEKILHVLVIYALVIFGGGYLIRYLIRSLLETSGHPPGEKSKEVVNAGLYIGWLERFVLVTAIFLQSPSTAGLIFAAKTIARYPNMRKDPHFIEYFLIGTLLSMSIAIGGALVLLKVFNGTVVLEK